MATTTIGLGRGFATSLDLSTTTREAMVDLCNQQLADSFDLYSQLKQAHWNIKGKDFFQLHALFDTLAAGVLAHVDLIAERATALGGYATGTARMAVATSALPEYPTDAVDGPDHVRALVERYADYAASTRRAIDAAMEAGDQSTADMFTEVSRQTDKDLWFLEAHLQA
jgi:starvation-inducible DNA-binding protein